MSALSGVIYAPTVSNRSGGSSPEHERVEWKINTESADVRVDGIAKGSGEFVKSGLRVWGVMCPSTRFYTTLHALNLPSISESTPTVSVSCSQFNSSASTNLTPQSQSLRAQARRHQTFVRNLPTTTGCTVYSIVSRCCFCLPSYLYSLLYTHPGCLWPGQTGTIRTRR